MPLRINLLAEEHAQEELRRRDPVKRALWVGASLVALVLMWSSSLLAQSMLGKSKLSGLQGDLNARTNDYRQVLDNKRHLEEINSKLQALQRLATNRFLVGNMMNALQQATMNEVQLTRLRLDQAYIITEETRANSATKERAKPATSMEKITLLLDAKDMNPDPGASIGKFQEKLSTLPYFQSSFGKPAEFNLKQRGNPQTDSDKSVSVIFSLECRFPDKTR